MSAYYTARIAENEELPAYFDGIISTEMTNTFEMTCADINTRIEQLSEAQSRSKGVLDTLLRHVDYAQLAASNDPQAKTLMSHFESAMQSLSVDELKDYFLFSLQFKFMDHWSVAMFKQSPTLGVSTSKEYLSGLNGLMGAITSGNEELALDIIRNTPEAIDYVASVDYDMKGHSPLTLAILNNQAEVVKAIVALSPQTLDYVIKNNADYNGFTPLKVAQFKNPKVVGLLKPEPESQTRPDVMRFTNAASSSKDKPLSDGMVPDPNNTPIIRKKDDKTGP